MACRVLAETPGLAAENGASEGETIYFRGGNTFDMSPADLSNSVDKTIGLMKQKGVSLNTDKWNKFVQQYGGERGTIITHNILRWKG
jgi:hypothetical protein